MERFSVGDIMEMVNWVMALIRTNTYQKQLLPVE